MNLLELPYSDEPELIDNPSTPEDDVARSMDDLVTVNRFFGGIHSVVVPLLRLLRDVPAGGAVRILDIGTGSGDIPRAVVAALVRRGIAATVVGVDLNWRMLRMAAARPDDDVCLVRADALALPFADASFEVALCSMTLHHLGLEASASLLKAFDRLTTRGFVVTDLVRDRISQAMMLTGLRLMRARPMTLHDADASVRRAFTLRDAEKLVGLSGVQGVRIDSTWHYRLRIVQEKASG